MHAHMTKAALVDYDRLAGEEALTALLSRRDLEAARSEAGPAELWFDLQRDDEEALRLSIDVSPDDLDEILRLSTGDDVLLALDGPTIAGLFDEPDVEAHGLRAAFAVAVATAAVGASTAQAATLQTASAASTAQRAQVAATAQKASVAAKAQVATQISQQVTKQVAYAQRTKAQAGKLSFKLLRAGVLVR